MDATRRIEIAEPSQVAEVRRTVSEHAAALGFDETDVGRAALVATEAATNVLKHAGRGELLINARREPAQLELLCLDAGPGFNAEHAMVDGYSTAGTLGGGLGAMRRLSAELEIWSHPGRGSALRAVLRPARAPAPARAAFEVGALAVAHPGETVCGDDFAYRCDGDCALFVVADGLGHGRDARKASAAAVAELPPAPYAPELLLQRAHLALRGTRGAAVAATAIDAAALTVRHAGVGNVTSVIVATAPVATKSMVSMMGIVGHNMRKAQRFEYPFAPDALLIMYSDGLGTHWKLDDYPGLRNRHPALVAAVLYRDHARGRDDVTVLVARLTP